MHAQQEPDRSRAEVRLKPSVRNAAEHAAASASAQVDAQAAEGPITPQRLLELQRSVGNAAAANLLARQGHEHSDQCGHAPTVQRSSVHDVLTTPGVPFTGPLAERVSDHYGGVDLSHIRVHTDPVAQRSATEIGARAYTSGHHVVLNSNATEKDVRHEVAHTFQQAVGPVSGKDHGDGLKISEPDSPEEKAAEAAAQRPLPGPAGSAAPAQSARPAEPALQRSAGIDGPGRPVQRADQARPSSAQSGRSAGSDKTVSSYHTALSGGSAAAASTTSSQRRLSEYERDKAELTARINRIAALQQDTEFKEAIQAWLNNLTEAEPGTAAVDTIIARITENHGFELPYEWVARHQYKAGFQDGADRQTRTGRGHLWSKLSAETSANLAESEHGLVLERTIGGALFNGLLFGLDNFRQSPSMGDLWTKMSQTYVKGLRGVVEASALGGIDDTSVLHTVEWPELKQKIEAGYVDGMNVVVYSVEEVEGAGKQLMPKETVAVRTAQDYEALPRVEQSDEWRQQQSQVDTEEKEKFAARCARDEAVAVLDRFVSENVPGSLLFRTVKTPDNTPVTSSAGSSPQL
jgi:hypothetical protein